MTNDGFKYAGKPMHWNDNEGEGGLKRMEIKNNSRILMECAVEHDYEALNAKIREIEEENARIGERLPFNYKAIKHCGFPLPLTGRPHVTINCGDPAMYHVWWGGGREMFVCKTHFEKIIKNEGGVGNAPKDKS